VDLKKYGPTTRGPLGWIVGGRSGDKASDANVRLLELIAESKCLLVPGGLLCPK
jgi:hypothetical protein